MSAPPARAARAASSDAAGRASAVGVVASLVAFALVGLPKLLVYMGPKLAWFDFGPRFSTTALFGVLTSVFLIVLVARGKLAGRMGAIASLATLGWLPMISFAAFVARGLPVIDATGFVGEVRTVSIGALMSVGMLVPLVWVSTSVAAWARFPEADRFIRIGAWTSLLVIAVASGVAISRAGRPDADTYVASLPVVQSTPEFRLTDGTRFSYRSRYLWPEQVTVRHDERLDLWVVEDSWFARFAFFGSDRRARGIHDSLLGRFIAPPVGWTAGAVVGLGLEIGLLACALRVQRRRRREPDAGGVEGIADKDGWALVPGMPPMHLAGVGAATPGPVVLYLRGGAAPSSYRDAGTGLIESWRPGTLDGANDERAGRVTTLYALAMTSGLLCAAPLLLSGLGGSR